MAESFGTRLRRTRNAHGLTLSALADRTRLSRSFLHDLEHDRTGISAANLLRLVDVLGIPAVELLVGGPVPASEEPQADIIPRTLAELAEDEGLPYSHVMALVDISQILVHRVGRRIDARADWQDLHRALRPFLSA